LTDIAEATTIDSSVVEPPLAEETE